MGHKRNGSRLYNKQWSAYTRVLTFGFLLPLGASLALLAGRLGASATSGDVEDDVADSVDTWLPLDSGPF